MKLIKLTQEKFAQVDNSDYNWLNQWKWCAVCKKGKFYAERGIKVNGKYQVQSMHRLIMNTPDHLQVDHENHNGLNCQRYNMRNCTYQQNQMNKIPRGRSKYLGVCITAKGYIIASICVNMKRKYIGLFKTEESAARAYDIQAKLHHGEFANLNFK